MTDPKSRWHLLAGAQIRRGIEERRLSTFVCFGLPSCLWVDLACCCCGCYCFLCWYQSQHFQAFITDWGPAAFQETSGFLFSNWYCWGTQPYGLSNYWVLGLSSVRQPQRNTSNCLDTQPQGMSNIQVLSLSVWFSCCYNFEVNWLVNSLYIFILSVLFPQRTLTYTHLLLTTSITNQPGTSHLNFSADFIAS